MEHGIFGWLVFFVTIITLLILDLGFFSRRGKKIAFKQSVLLSSFYLLVAIAFGCYIHIYLGADKSKEYFTGFLIEKAMALDNIFIISVIFKFFAIPILYQRRILLWGILGVIILRAIMIFLGLIILKEISWILYIFAAGLIVTGVKMLFVNHAKPINIRKLYIYHLLCKYVRITSQIRNDKFFIRIGSAIYTTPLFVALVMIEFMDLIFAIDSIPAIFAITTDPYIVYTSNIFAILGLRALFFCLENVVEKFKYIKYSLGVILIFIGGKIFVNHFVEVPIYFTLLITTLLLLGGVLFSILENKFYPNKP